MTPEKRVRRGELRRKADRLAATTLAEQTADQRGHRHRSLLRENWYRDVWLLGITAVVLVSVFTTATKVERQREGRAVAVDVVCGATSAIIDAGRATLTGGKVGPPDFVHKLEGLGFPPKKQREQAARAAATAYAKSVAAAVVRESGVKGLVRSDGTLNCSKLRRAAGTASR